LKNGEIDQKTYEFGSSLNKNIIANNFQNQPPHIKEKANHYVQELLLKLRIDLYQLKDRISIVEQEVVKKNFDSPECMKIFEKAMNIAAITEDYTKKDILSKIVRNRLLVESETFEAMCTKKALESIEYLTTKQLYILGYLQMIDIVDKRKDIDEMASTNFDEYLQYLHDTFLFCSFEVNFQDIEFLKDLNLLYLLLNRQVFLGAKLFSIIFHDKQAEKNNFFKTGLGQKISVDWEVNGLKYANLTKTGIYLGKTVVEVWASLLKPIKQ